MELPFGEFDLILGMDWLVKYRASLDCAAKRMVSKTTEDKEGPKNYLHKGCEAFLAYIGVSDSEGSSVKGIRTIKDFPDVFPDELSRFPLSREVKFDIELLPRTAPVSIAPYRMAPKDLVELKAEIQELLDRGFVRPSVSPWGAPVLFVKNKDGSMPNALSRRAVADLRAMVARLSLLDDGSLMVELQVKLT
ncbi:uncharacterized protein [Gossypium hirsutum]|uniref:DNA/RNA polymerases superfamily protein n=1 Tax=Gossypium hirsutum TaxID=3635 RepID=A0ABM2YX27_GOSHI|nr:uncharacterized protein LOC121207979 [Gossypium hirsutum]